MGINSIRQVIVDTYKKNWKPLLAMSFNIVVVTLACVAVDMYLPCFLILGYFLVILPFYISMLITNIKFKVDSNFSSKEFYRNYRLGLIPGLNSAFRSFRSLFITLLVFFGLCLGIFYGAKAFNLIDTTLLDNYVNTLRTNPSLEVYGEFQNYLTQYSDPFVMFFAVLVLGSYAIALFTFICLVLENTFVFFIESNFACSKADAINIHKKTFPKIKKLYVRLIWSTCWPVLILYPVGFISGVTITSLCSNQISMMLIGGVACALLFSMPMLPMFVTSHDVLFSVFMPYYLVEASDILLATLKRINQDTMIPEDQKDILRKFYVDQLKQIDQIKAANEKGEHIIDVTMTSNDIDDKESSNNNDDENHDSDNKDEKDHDNDEKNHDENEK